MLRPILVVSLMTGLLVGTSTNAQDITYLDDRSTPLSLVTSYFNAINSHQYVRAWSYEDHEGTDDNYEGMVEAFSEVQTVEFRVGKFAFEGAAGSIFTQIPLIMVRNMNNGDSVVFSGCFTTRIANPEIQEIPFEPLHIWESDLIMIKANFATAEFAQCTD